MGKKVLRKQGAIKRFKDLEPGDPIYLLNPYKLDILESMVYNVKHWDNVRNVSGEAIEVVFYKVVTDIANIDIEKLKEAEKHIDDRVHQSLIVNKEHYLVITHKNASSVPIPMSTDKDILKAWVRGERI